MEKKQTRNKQCSHIKVLVPSCVVTIAEAVILVIPVVVGVHLLIGNNWSRKITSQKRVYTRIWFREVYIF